MSIAAVAAGLNGQVDLYAGLRASGVAAGDLPLLLAACDAPTRARLLSVDQGLLRAILRHAAGEVGPVQQIVDHLRRGEPALMFRPDPAKARTVALLTEGQIPDMPAFSDRAFDAWFTAKGVDYGLGLYAEKRSVYQTPQFADAASPERRTIHTGLDVFALAGTPVYAPLAGKAIYVTYNADPLDYGHTLILQHDAGGVPFYTLYGHLAGTLPGLVAVGDSIEPGQLIAHLGDWHENGGWAAHIHFQIMSDMLEQTGGNFFGVGHESLWDVWSAICPDPNLILRIPAEKFTL
jgi:murein DD-endopeptidase MepM/ murein hydrolase activator NlpD